MAIVFQQAFVEITQSHAGRDADALSNGKQANTRKERGRKNGLKDLLLSDRSLNILGGSC